MGWSAGGYSSLILPLLHPNVWGAIGTNDACPGIVACNVFNMPDGDVLDVYPGAGLGLRATIQAGAAAAPNPDVAIGFDWPKNPDRLEKKEKWNAYCPMNPETISQHQGTLNNLLEIALVVTGDSGETCQWDNLEMIKQLEKAGIAVTRLDSPGGHSSFLRERYISVAERLLKAMEGAQTSVSPQGSMTVTWGAIKQGL